MPLGLRDHLLPTSQLRTLEELTHDLDMTAGDARAKRSAFWTMLTLSAVIASAGVLADSTATVIGAMIIAPLSTPIMGFALNLVTRRRTQAALFVLGGTLLVIAVGLVSSFALPGSYDLLANSEVSSRTSPGLVDLVAAMATGLAGAVALSRRDVGAVLPGVAIAISLVPPLAVVGVCLGQGSVGLSLGALVLFLSNLLALVLTGTLVFAALGYATLAQERRGGPKRRAYVALTALIVLVAVPLATNTAFHYLLSVWTARVEQTTQEWLADEPSARVLDVTISSNDYHIRVRAPRELPPVRDLMTSLEGVIPDGTEVIIEHEVGGRLDAGVVGKG